MSQTLLVDVGSTTNTVSAKVFAFRLSAGIFTTEVLLSEPFGIALLSYLSGFFTLLQLLKGYVATYVVDCSLLFSHGLKRKLMRWPVVSLDYEATCTIRRVTLTPAHHGDPQQNSLGCVVKPLS